MGICSSKFSPKLYIGESGGKLGDRFREHLLDVKNKGSDLCKPVARHFNLPGHSHVHMEICGIYLHFGNSETRKRKEQRIISKLGTLGLVYTSCFHGTHFNSIRRGVWHTLGTRGNSLAKSGRPNECEVRSERRERRAERE